VSVIVLTGASSGIGAAAAVELTSRGHQVVATGRSREKLEGVHARMSSVADGVTVPEPIVADLASMGEVRRLASDLRDRFADMNVLVNNAGLATRRRETSPDGFEMTFAVNHLAPFLLTNLMLDRLRASGGRVVTTSSGAHRFGRLDLDDLNMTRGWSRSRSYGASKRANILFTSELRRRTGLPATCFHPGGVRTDLARQQEPWMKTLQSAIGPLMRSPEKGADTLVWLTTSEEGGHPAAVYYANRKPARTASAASDQTMAERLWDRSADMVKLNG
jgi:NAD(P)-dependent dehydrogenase (short-subunit alcohol dehydrogenase family)